MLLLLYIELPCFILSDLARRTNAGVVPEVQIVFCWGRMIGIRTMLPLFLLVLMIMMMLIQVSWAGAWTYFKSLNI